MRKISASTVGGEVPASGAPLPAPLLASMEGLFDHNFSGVRIFESAELTRLGAEAAAGDECIFFAPGFFQPETASGWQRIGHELAHIVQQRAGYVASGDGSRRLQVIRHEDLEQQAEAQGQRAGELFRCLASRPSGGTSGLLGSPSRLPPHALQGSLQLRVQVMNPPSQVFNKASAMTTLNSVGAARGNFPGGGADRIYYNNHQVGCDGILRGWIEGGYLEMLPVVGRQATKLHTRQYANYADLLHAVVSEHRAQANIQTEDRLAYEANNSSEIEQGLAGALRAVHTKIQTLGAYRRNAIMNELSTYCGSYFMYYRRTRFGTNVGSYIGNPQAAYVTTNIAIFHDLMEYFLSKYDRDGQGRGPHMPKKTAGQGLIREEARYEMGSLEYQDLRGRQMVVNFPLFDDYRNNLATPNESSGQTQSARQHDMPMWASHSWTTLRLMALVKWASGDNLDHYEAVAWAIFAFWNRTVLQGMHPIHRFHEVMDIAKNYGVYYREFRYPDHAPGYNPNRPLSNWYSRLMR